MVKQITVEELFGSSLPKDPSLPTMPTQNTTAASSDPSTAYLQNQSFPTSAHQNPLLPHHLAAQEPGPNQRHQAPGLLPSPYALHPSPVFQTGAPRSDPQPLCSVSPLMVPPAGSETRAAPTGPAAPSAAPAAYLGQEILSTLKPAVPSVSSDIHKPILAPNFLPSTLFPPHSFQEHMGKPLLQHGKEMDVFSQPPNVIKPMSVSSKGFLEAVFVQLFADITLINVSLFSLFYTTTDTIIIQHVISSSLSLPFYSQAVPMSPGLAISRPEVSVLLSPSAFQQSMSKTTTSVVPSAPPEPSSTSVGAAELTQAPCSKTQLQETLIHLIKVQQGHQIQKAVVLECKSKLKLFQTHVKLRMCSPKFQNYGLILGCLHHRNFPRGPRAF